MIIPFLVYLCLALLSPSFELPLWPSELKSRKSLISVFQVAARDACVTLGNEHAYLFLFIQILSVQKVINRDTNALPILNQALTGETECCDLEHLIHRAQSLQSALRDPQGDLWGPVDL
jgi:hypothetical protein